jgi:hypothetical protein
MTQGRIVKWLAGGAVVVAVWVGVAWAADLWSRLGVTQAQAKTESVQAFVGGNVPFYLAAKAVMAAPPAARAALVVEGLTWVKSFVGSAEFKTAYATARQNLKPGAPASKGTPDQQVKAQIDEQRQNIEEAKKNLALLPPDARKDMEVTIKQLEGDLQRFSTDPEAQALVKERAAAEDKNTQDQYKARLAEWEKDYPADGSVLVARRLQQFLDVSADVDYAAKLTKNPMGRMTFSDQRYEEKPSEWKLCYRAGRETVEATRAFAKTWLGELTKR